MYMKKNPPHGGTFDTLGATTNKVVSVAQVEERACTSPRDKYLENTRMHGRETVAQTAAQPD